MSNATTRHGYAVLQKGALREEIWEWADLEAMARSGGFSPESLIFFADENTWKKAIDTRLSVCFEAPGVGLGPGDSNRDLEDEYEAARVKIRENPSEQGPVLHAAEIALAMGDADAARDHYQHALEMTPFHPRVAQEAKRNLPPARWKTLKFLEKPPYIWEEPLRLAAYPVARGPLYMLAPVVVIFASSWSIWTMIPACFLLGVWMMEIIAVSSHGREKPPPWNVFVSDRAVTHLKRSLVLAGVVAELYLPFVAVAVVLMMTGQSDRTNLFETVAGSPVMSVVIFTVSLLYLPAVLSLIPASLTARTRDVLNPKCVVAAIRLMEGEYIAVLGFILVLLCGMWGLGRLLEIIPLAPRIFHAAAVTYIALAVGLVLGRLHSRFREQLSEPASRSAGA